MPFLPGCRCGNRGTRVCGRASSGHAPHAVRCGFVTWSPAPGPASAACPCQSAPGPSPGARPTWPLDTAFGAASEARSVPGELRIQLLDPGFDVVPDQAHAFHAFDAAFGGLIRIPDLEPLALAGLRLLPRCPGRSRRRPRSVTSSVTGLGCSPVMSMPSSARDSTDWGFSDVPGLVPAECTATVPFASWFISPAASWDFPPFLLQTNRTLGFFVVSVMRSILPCLQLGLLSSDAASAGRCSVFAGAAVGQSGGESDEHRLGSARSSRVSDATGGSGGDVAAGAGVGGADAGLGEFELDGVRRLPGLRPGRRRRSGPVRSRWRAGTSAPGRRTSCRRCRSPCPGGPASLGAVRGDGAAGVEFRVDERAEFGGCFDGRVQVQPEFAQDVQVRAEAGAGNDDVGLEGPAVHGFDGDVRRRGLSGEPIAEAGVQFDVPASTRRRRRAPSWPRAGSPSASPPP